MAFPENTASLSIFLAGLDPFPIDAMGVTISGGVVSIDHWDATALGRAEPTEQELTDAANGTTLVNGQTFAQWEAEHGGDATATRRRIAKEFLLADDNVVIRAIVLALIDQLNAVRQDPNTVKSVITKAAALNGIAAKIDAGDAD